MRRLVRAAGRVDPQHRARPHDRPARACALGVRVTEPAALAAVVLPGELRELSAEHERDPDVGLDVTAGLGALHVVAGARHVGEWLDA
jgi:hypothetical protein